MTEQTPPKSKLRQVRILVWIIVLLAIAGIAALLLIQRVTVHPPQATTTGAAPSSFGGPFTLIDGDGKPFSSEKLLGKPYVMYFGFTRCGDVCPTTLSRLVKLRRAAANDTAMAVLFVTIDPANDGPKEVGQYAGLFGSPIIGLTGSQAQIDQVKKQYGIFAQAAAHPSMGQEMEHSTAVLLFGRDGRLAGTISPQDTDAEAIAKIKAVIA